MEMNGKRVKSDLKSLGIDLRISEERAKKYINNSIERLGKNHGK